MSYVVTNAGVVFNATGVISHATCWVKSHCCIHFSEQQFLQLSCVFISQTPFYLSVIALCHYVAAFEMTRVNLGISVGMK